MKMACRLLPISTDCKSPDSFQEMQGTAHFGNRFIAVCRLSGTF